MWPWQHNNIHKKHLLWLKLSSVCLIGHCIVLLAVFCIYKGNHSLDAFSICKHTDYSSPILFVPWGHAIVHTKTAHQTNIIPIIIDQEPPKVALLSTKKQTSTLTSLRTEKRNTTIPIAQAPTKIESPLVAEKTKKPSLQQNIPNKKIIETVHVSPDAHVSHNYKEVEILKRTTALQQEITRTWKPPFNAQHNALCDITCTITHDGSIKEIFISKSSGNIMYDLSAQHAVCAMNMPSWTYGKKITLTFTL
jgi:hypothetical protein